MPVYLDLASLIFDKKILDQKYKGGSNQFRIDWNVTNSKVHQEDDELLSLAEMDMNDFDIDKLIEGGLAFDYDLLHSNDFAGISRYGGSHWETAWLKHNGTFAWHISCAQKQKDRAAEIGEKMTTDEAKALFDKGINVFDTIKSPTKN